MLYERKFEIETSERKEIAVAGAATAWSERLRRRVQTEGNWRSGSCRKGYISSRTRAIPLAACWTVAARWLSLCNSTRVVKSILVDSKKQSLRSLAAAGDLLVTATWGGEIKSWQLPDLTLHREFKASNWEGRSFPGCRRRCAGGC